MSNTMKQHEEVCILGSLCYPISSPKKPLYCKHYIHTYAL